jgi:hypothetical protein
MSKLHAQMALLGAIDEAVQQSEDPNTLKVVESFLPGTTGIGQQGWYRELKRFLNRPELAPRDGGEITGNDSVTFPSVDQAVSELNAQTQEGEPDSPAMQSRALFAATVLSIVGVEEPNLRIEGWDRSGPDPLDALLRSITRNLSEPFPPFPNSGSGSSGDPVQDLKAELHTLKSRQAYVDFTLGLARTRLLDPFANDVLSRPVVCTGSLRKVDGKFCTLLTTDWDAPFTLSAIKELIDPHNWPELCDFFASMDDQPAITPDMSRGWTRLLESVSGDKTQWEMRTALRFWNGLSKPGDGIYVNYDLDNPRVGDSKVVEVDAGYIWATPHTPGDPNSTVRIRTCKQVRIRGVSSTATAALACGFGWGDAMSQMFDHDPPADNTKFVASKESAAAGNTATGDGSPVKRPTDGEQSDTDIEAAAEEVELVVGWRGAIIEAMRLQLTKGIGKAEKLGTDFAVRWSDGDGFGLEDVTEFGKSCGEEATQYAADTFKAAAAALQPQTDGADATGGNV